MPFFFFFSKTWDILCSIPLPLLLSLLPLFLSPLLFLSPEFLILILPPLVPHSVHSGQEGILPGPETNYRNSSVPFFFSFVPRMYLSERGEKRQWVASGTERQRETELIRLISRQKTVGGEINGERQQNGGSRLCK